jgi:hypothetical protein
MKYLLALSLLCAAGYAAAQDAPSLLAEPPRKTAGLNEIVKYEAKEGYHFNLKAPQECGDAEAFDVSKKDLKCKFSAAGEQAVSLKICDDKETACMFEDFTVLVAGEAKAQAAAAPEGLKDTGLDGFLLNDAPGALAQAKKEHRLLFIDFFGRWCPPCRVMEDTVLTQPSFLAATANMVRVSLDVDRPAAREWRSRFKPTGYPTYLIADAELNEIGRWSGSGNLAAFNAWIKDQEKWKDQPIEKAKAGVATLDEAGKIRVAKEYMAGENWAEARKLLAGINTRAAAYLAAQAQVQEADSTDTVKMTELYRGLIKRFDGSDGQPAEGAALDWTAALQKIDPAAAKPYIAGLDALVGRLLVSKDAEAEGYGPEDVLYQAAVGMDDAGLKDLAKGFYARAAKAYGGLADRAARPELAKGLRMSQARCLMGAELYADGAAVYGGLAKQFPAEYAFHRSYAGALLQLKKYPEALGEATLAARLSYGDIHFSIVILKARIELAQKNKTGAIKTLDDAVAEADASKLSSRGLKEYLEKVKASN